MFRDLDQIDLLQDRRSSDNQDDIDISRRFYLVFFFTWRCIACFLVYLVFTSVSKKRGSKTQSMKLHLINESQIVFLVRLSLMKSYDLKAVKETVILVVINVWFINLDHNNIFDCDVIFVWKS